MPDPNGTSSARAPTPGKAPGKADQPPTIRVEGVVKRFDGRAVLDGLTFDVRRGETMVIMGGSGSGKSTMLRCMISGP